MKASDRPARRALTIVSKPPVYRGRPSLSAEIRTRKCIQNQIAKNLFDRFSFLTGRDQHNGQLPHSAFKGQTPDEMYFGTGNDVPKNCGMLTHAVSGENSRLKVPNVLANSTDGFLAHVRQHLAPTLLPGDIVVIDNLPAQTNGSS